jgi:hypothetical protein
LIRLGWCCREDSLDVPYLFPYLLEGTFGRFTQFVILAFEGRVLAKPIFDTSVPIVIIDADWASAARKRDPIQHEWVARYAWWNAAHLVVVSQCSSLEIRCKCSSTTVRCYSESQMPSLSLSPHRCRLRRAISVSGLHYYSVSSRNVTISKPEG